MGVTLALPGALILSTCCGTFGKHTVLWVGVVTWMVRSTRCGVGGGGGGGSGGVAMRIVTARFNRKLMLLHTKLLVNVIFVIFVFFCFCFCCCCVVVVHLIFFFKKKIHACAVFDVFCLRCLLSVYSFPKKKGVLFWHALLLLNLGGTV